MSWAAGGIMVSSMATTCILKAPCVAQFLWRTVGIGVRMGSRPIFVKDGFGARGEEERSGSLFRFARVQESTALHAA